MNWQQIKDNVTSGLLVAVIVGVIGSGAALLGTFLYNQLIAPLFVPSGAIVAFDVTAKKPCPTGWKLLRDADSRFIVGATPPDQNATTVNKHGTPLSRRPFRMVSGEESVALSSVAEIPPHSHGLDADVFVFPGDAGDFLKSANNSVIAGFPYSPTLKGLSATEAKKRTHKVKTVAIGGDPKNDDNTEKHDNMPPFIALYFCKKE